MTKFRSNATEMKHHLSSPSNQHPHVNRVSSWPSKCLEHGPGTRISAMKRLARDHYSTSVSVISHSGLELCSVSSSKGCSAASHEPSLLMKIARYQQGTKDEDGNGDNRTKKLNCNQEETQRNHRVTSETENASLTRPVRQIYKYTYCDSPQTPSQRCHSDAFRESGPGDEGGNISLEPAGSHKQRSYSIAVNLPQRILTTIFVYAILSHLSRYETQSRVSFNQAQQQRQQVLRIFPTLITAVTAAASPSQDNNPECRTDNDCEDPNRICHESKCICKRDRPIDDKGICLPLAVVGELCSLSDQCLGNSACLDGVCACASNTISLFNPSTQIFYCHPKRGLHGECSHDAQCPNNAFCSTNKHGCLCQNGFGPATVKNEQGVETSECLPKRCSVSRECESEFHTCDDNRCYCLATHFDPHTAECYKFGSTGGKVDGLDQLTRPGSRNATGASLSGRDEGTGFTRSVKDLMKRGDMLWLVVIILALLTLLLLTLMIMIVRKYYLGYCWTARKKEYEPNSENGPAKSQAFSKGSINNKSFRKKTNDGDTTDDDQHGGGGGRGCDEDAAGGGCGGGGYDNDNDDDDDDYHGDGDHRYNHHQNKKHVNDDTAADRSNLVTVPGAMKTRNTRAGGTNGNIFGGQMSNGDKLAALTTGRTTNGATKMNGLSDVEDRYVKVDMRAPALGPGDRNGHDRDFANGYNNQLLGRPLATSTSTPV